MLNFEITAKIFSISELIFEFWKFMVLEFHFKLLITKNQLHFPFLLSQTLQAVEHTFRQEIWELKFLHTIKDKGKPNIDHSLLKTSKHTFKTKFPSFLVNSSCHKNCLQNIHATISRVIFTELMEHHEVKKSRYFIKITTKSGCSRYSRSKI